MTLAGLADDATGEPAEWLGHQGAADVSARDYWSVTENPWNIYYSWALNLRQGSPRNYAKSFPLFVWPVRKPVISEWGYHKPAIKINNRLEELQITQGDPITLTAAISEIENAMEADFKIWYEAPDKSKWWLSDNGTWQVDEKPLYRGRLFPLTEYPVFSGHTTEMATGIYTIHFDISLLLEEDAPLPLFPTIFSSTFSLAINRAIPDQANILWNAAKK